MALLVGTVDDKPFRTEVTLLDQTRVMPWAGMQVRWRCIHEVAYDLYAQDDEGNVWYFGEDCLQLAGRRDPGGSTRAATRGRLKPLGVPPRGSDSLIRRRPAEGEPQFRVRSGRSEATQSVAPASEW